MEYLEHLLSDILSVTSIVNARRLHCAKEWKYEGERHSCWELQYMASGDVYIHLHNRFYKLREGELVLLSPDTFHVIYGDGENDAQMWVISFSVEGDGLDGLGRGAFTVSNRCRALLSAVIDDVDAGFSCSERTDVPALLTRLRTAPIGNDQLIRVQLEQVLLLLLQSDTCMSVFAGRLELQSHCGQDFLAERIREYMLQHVEGQLRLSQVAQAFYISESMVKTTYKKQFGVSLIADYHRQKVERAKILLSRSELNIGQISARLGFENVYHFSNFFKKYTNLAPSHYRKNIE
ncbi:MAG: AraC family transcriptional regulator [Clostridiales bacterium]|nr:AraC family transcriptional regulator [Clostridiales bacterium]